MTLIITNKQERCELVHNVNNYIFYPKEEILIVDYYNQKSTDTYHYITNVEVFDLAKHFRFYNMPQSIKPEEMFIVFSTICRNKKLEEITKVERDLVIYFSYNYNELYKYRSYSNQEIYKILKQSGVDFDNDISPWEVPLR